MPGRHLLAALLVAGTLTALGCPRSGEPERTGATEAAGEHHEEGEHKERGPAEEGGAHKEGGEAHEEGVVTLDEAAQREVGITITPAAVRRLATELVTTGEFEANANREAHVTTRIAGRVSAVSKNVGDRVRRGERLAMLESVELGQAQAAYLQALARWELTASTAARQRALFQQDLVARKEVLTADNALRLTRIELDNAQNQLALYGFGADRIAALRRSRALDPTVALLAPIAGVVVARHLTIGELLRPESEQPAFSISDVSELWVDAAVFEKDLAQVHVGQPATVTTPAYPGRAYRGRVSLVSTALEKASRTATARVVVPNADGRLKPDMTATVRIAVGDRRALAVPAGAIVRDQAETYVFVREGTTRFEKHPVEIGPEVDGWVPVTVGVKAGDPVVGKGSFTLKAELTKESFGEHGH